MMAATAIPTLLNSMRPDDDRSDLRGNSFTVVGASIPRSTNTRCTVSSVKSGGVLKKWTIFEGGCILFLLAIAGFRNLKPIWQRIPFTITNQQHLSRISINLRFVPSDYLISAQRIKMQTTRHVLILRTGKQVYYCVSRGEMKTRRIWISVESIYVFRLQNFNTSNSSFRD